ncbi:MAG: M16 family metallopeptidase [Chitinophagaceae bacterium]
MKKIFFPILFFILLASEAGAQIDRSHAPLPGPAPEIKIGYPEHFQLSNGLKVFVVENHQLPKVSATLTLKVDPVMEDDKAGYVDMEGEILRRGTATRTKADLDEAIDDLGGVVTTNSRGAFAFSLTKNFDRIFSLMADIVLHPSFPASQLAEIKKQTLSALAQGKDDPRTIMANVSAVLTYGSNHPYGEVETTKTVNHISLADLENYYHTYWKPNVGYLVLVGDITEGQAETLVNKYFGKWKPGVVPPHHYALPAKPAKTLVAIVDRPSAVQTNINIEDPIDLHPGDMENFPASVMNDILGGGATSHLFLDLREKHGYTYGAYSNLASDPLVGSFSAGGAVRNEVTDSAIARFLTDLQDIRDHQVPQNELDQFKRSLSGNFARSLEDPSRIAQFALNIALYNMPKDFYITYLKNLDAVTAAQVQQAARDFVTPKQAYIILVGDAREIAPKLSRFGKVEYFDHNGKEIQPAVASPVIPPGMTASQVIHQYIRAVGGSKKLKAVQDLVISGEGETPNGPINILQKLMSRGNYLQQVMVPAQHLTVMKITVLGPTVKMDRMGQNIPLDDTTQSRIRDRAEMFPELNFFHPGYHLKLMGIAPVDGKNAYEVKVTYPDGTSLINFYDMHTGLKLEEWQTPGNATMGNQEVKVLMSNYQIIQGIAFPFTLTTHAGPALFVLQVKKILINSGLKDADFN